MMQKSLIWDPLLGMPVKLSNGIADQKTTIKLTYTGDFLVSKTGCLFGCLTEFVQGTTMNKQISLFSLWKDTLMRQQSNLKNC